MSSDRPLFLGAILSYLLQFFGLVFGKYYSSKDTLVYPQNADSLQKALTQAGGNVERVQVPATHAGIVIGLATPLQSFYPTFNKVNDFMQRHLPTAQ